MMSSNSTDSVTLIKENCRVLIRPYNMVGTVLEYCEDGTFAVKFMRDNKELVGFFEPHDLIEQLELPFESKVF